MILTTSADYWGKRLAIAVAIIWLAGLLIGFQNSLLILTTIGFGAALAGVFRPSLGLLGVGMLVTMDSVSRGYLSTGGLFRWNSFNYLLLAVMILFLPLLLRIKDLHSKLLQIFTLLLVLQLLIASDTANGIQHILNMVTSFGLLVYFLRARSDIRVWYWLAAVNSLLSALGGFVFHLDSQSLSMNPNAWAIFPVTGLLSISLGFWSVTDKRDQLIFVLLAGVNTVWTFLTGSRGGMLIALVVLFIIAARIGSQKLGIAYTCGFLFIALVVVAMFPNLRDAAVMRVTSLFDESRSTTNRTSGRSDLAKAAWELFLNHPLGVGTGGFASEFARLEIASEVFRSHEKQAHSGWMKVLAENGIVGIVLLSLYVLSFSWVGWHSRNRELLFSGLLTTLVLAVSFLTTEFQGKDLWFLAAGTTVLLHHRVRVSVIKPLERRYEQISLPQLHRALGMRRTVRMS